MDTVGTERRDGAQLFHGAGTPALAPDDQHRLLDGQPADVVAERPGGTAEEDCGARTGTEHAPRAARFLGTRAQGNQDGLSRCEDYARRTVGRIQPGILTQFSRPDGPALQEGAEDVHRHADKDLRDRPYLRHRPVQRNCSAEL